MKAVIKYYSSYEGVEGSESPEDDQKLHATDA